MPSNKLDGKLRLIRLDPDDLNPAVLLLNNKEQHVWQPYGVLW